MKALSRTRSILHDPLEPRISVPESGRFNVRPEELPEMLRMKRRKDPIAGETQTERAVILNFKTALPEAFSVRQCPAVAEKEACGSEVLPEIRHSAFCRVEHAVPDRLRVSVAEKEQDPRAAPIIGRQETLILEAYRPRRLVQLEDLADIRRVGSPALRPMLSKVRGDARIVAVGQMRDVDGVDDRARRHSVIISLDQRRRGAAFHIPQYGMPSCRHGMRVLRPAHGFSYVRTPWRGVM